MPLLPLLLPLLLLPLLLLPLLLLPPLLLLLPLLLPLLQIQDQETGDATSKEWESRKFLICSVMHGFCCCWIRSSHALSMSSQSTVRLYI